MANIFELKSNSLVEMLDVLTVQMMFHHLNISVDFRPKHLWSWVDRSQITSHDYLCKSFDMIIDSWTKFKCTGHGAIELGTIKNIPLLFPQNMLGLESTMLSSTDVFLKMNVDEYLSLVSNITMKLYNISSSQYLKHMEMKQSNIPFTSNKHYALPNNIEQDGINELKLKLTNIQGRIEDINKQSLKQCNLDDFKDLYDKRLIKLVQEFTKEIKELKLNLTTVQSKVEEISKQSVKKCKLDELKYDITNSIDEEVEKVCDYIDESVGDITECVNNIHRELRDELMNVNVELTALKGKSQTQKKIIDNYIKITLDNLLEAAVSFHNDNDIETTDIVEVIKLMLNSSKYILSDEFKNNKLDLKDIQFKFKELASPENITRDDVLLEVFNIDNSVSLL